MATKKAGKSTKRLKKAKKLQKTKTLIELESFSFGVSKPS